MSIGNEASEIVQLVLEHYPEVQAVYLFGSYGTADEWPGSDVDIALLLSPRQTREETGSAMSRCRLALADLLHRDVDLVNARHGSTVLQKEIIATGRILYCADRYAVDEFEMLVFSYYQKLNEERRELLKSFSETGRAYSV
jgi:uncharacterized protein